MTIATKVDPREVLDLLHGARGAMVAFLVELVRLESPSTEPATHGRIKERLGAVLRDAGLEVETVAGGHLLARPPGEAEDPIQLLLGHFDTVWPVGSADRLGVRASDGVVAGPGAYDMKAGLVVLVFALKTLRSLGVSPPFPPVAFINSDEEIGSVGSTSHIRALARRARRVFVLEPSLGLDGRLKTARKGSGVFTVVVRGEPAHPGVDPEAGASAIRELAEVIQALYELNDPATGITVNIGTVDGGIRANVVAPEAKAVVGVRVPTIEDGLRIESALRALRPSSPGCTLEVVGGMTRPPMERTPGNAALFELVADIGRELGLELQEGLSGGGSDANTASLYAPTLDGLGAVGDGAHAEHEFVYEGSLVERAALLALALMSDKRAFVEKRPVAGR